MALAFFLMIWSGQDWAISPLRAEGGKKEGKVDGLTGVRQRHSSHRKLKICSLKFWFYWIMCYVFTLMWLFRLTPLIIKQKRPRDNTSCASLLCVVLDTKKLMIVNVCLNCLIPWWLDVHYLMFPIARFVNLMYHNHNVSWWVITHLSTWCYVWKNQGRHWRDWSQ